MLYFEKIPVSLGYISVTRHVSAEFNPQVIKMSKKQTSLESFFSKRKRPSEETEEELTTSKKKKDFNREYQEFYLKYGFIYDR